MVRLDTPNVVRHGGVSGFSEEFNIIPLAPHRTRVLLRQRFPKGPILSTLLNLPFAADILRTTNKSTTLRLRRRWDEMHANANASCSIQCPSPP